MRKVLDVSDALKTYRYLRIGMVAAVLALAVSVLIERAKVDCWQNSISAYFYTPARAIFVSALIVIGVSLIVIRGRTPYEDFCLNIAGMLAPIVAVVPTPNVGSCYSITPDPLPKDNGELAAWWVGNIENNFKALLVVGAVGLVTAIVIALLTHSRVIGGGERLAPGTGVGLALTGVVLLVLWWAIENWKSFNTEAHNIAAITLFVFLIVAVFSKAVELRGADTRRYFEIYVVVGVSMVGGAIAMAPLDFGDHKVLVLEAFEITLFAFYWVVQTIENWNERTSPS